ncbi:MULTISPECIES: GlcG/HbpS family heme-binding protein [unclassified Rhizobium]|uniref:GlcG/HbpS family heme-binding protein n=1 Tax=unclassified Rhizobium TaxID=2613769 RepID=UPI001ADC2828|nr:heme-binding protein [Rhizobium sp. 16-488-2b]MBO9178224.1 heme-binding protein [Rhizobium sp. 16-488-2a]
MGNFSAVALFKPRAEGAILAISVSLALALSTQAHAQSVKAANDLDTAAARKVISAAVVEAQKGPPSSVFVVDTSGAIVAAERMDGAFPASAKIAQGKAEAAAAFWQSTSNLENAANGGRAALLSSGYVVMQGGIPLKVDGKVVGAIGVSGGNKDQDEAVAKAGVAAFSN